MSKRQILLMTFCLILSSNSYSDENDSLLFQIGEKILKWSGHSYDRLVEENQRLAKQLDDEREISANLRNSHFKELQIKENEIKDLTWQGHDEPKLFEIYEQKKSSKVQIDNCKLGYAGEPSDRGLERPLKLKVLSANIDKVLTYRSDIEGIYEVCDSEIKRKLWEFDEEIYSTSGVIVISDLEAKYKEIKPEEIVKIDDKAVPKYCKWFQYKTLTYKECNDGEGSAVLYGKFGKLLSSTTSGYGTPKISLLGEVRSGVGVFYHVIYNVKGGKEYALIAENGLMLYPRTCSLPTMC